MKRRDGSCWKKTSNLEKILILAVAVLLCFVLSLFIVLLLHQLHLFRSAVPLTETATACTKPQCIRAAAQIIDFVDPSVDPCENFYDFACGSFLKSSMETKEISVGSKLKVATENRLEALITQPLTEPLEKPLELQRKFYRSCMNTTAIEENDNNALLDLIAALGDWPIRLVRLWNKQKFHWLWTMAKCRHLGVGYEYFMSLTGTEATVNGTELMVLSIGPPATVNIPSQFREYYVELMVNISLKLKAYNYQLAKEEFIRVLQFEDQIRAFRKDENDFGQNVLIQIESLQSEFPTIPWVKFLNNITATSLPFTNNTWVIFRATRYLHNLLQLLSATPETVQANYVFWKMVESYSNYLNEEQRTHYNSFLVSLNPALDVNNRKAFCLSNAKFYFPAVSEVAYVRKYVQPETRSDIKEMIEKIRNELIDRISKNDWLDDKSKKAAEIKLNEIKWMVGASDSVYHKNFDAIVGMENFDLETDNVIQMSQKLSVRRMDKYFRVINRNLSDVLKEDLETSPILDSNALYLHKVKTLALFAPFLEGIMYDFQRPQYINYGAIGSVIGHEFIHGLLSQTNKQEGFETSWPSRTRKIYEEKINCLLEEYQNYTDHLQEFASDGTVALAENLADFVGPNLAYRAYQKRVQYQPPEETLPGLAYTPNQIFWIMFGAVKCYQPKLTPDYAYDERHGVPSFAVTFSMQNSPDFAKDFNCSVDSKMNPEKKCRIL